jgi:hypothetical protein
MDDSTKELHKYEMNGRNLRLKHVISGRKYEHSPQFPDTKKRLKRKKFHHEIPSETTAYNDGETATQ